jgi:hypothetical protein
MDLSHWLYRYGAPAFIQQEGLAPRKLKFLPVLCFSKRAYPGCSYDRFYFRYNPVFSCVWGVCGSFQGASQA